VQFAGELTDLGSEESPITIQRFQDISTKSNTLSMVPTDDGNSFCPVKYEVTLADAERTQQSFFTVTESEGSLVITGADTSEEYGLKQFYIRQVLMKGGGEAIIDEIESILTIELTNPCIENDQFSDIVDEDLGNVWPGSVQSQVFTISDKTTADNGGTFRCGPIKFELYLED
jgi:hypothetical protein